MELSSESLQWLVCPACHAALALQHQTVECQGCGLTYPVVDGLPVLLPTRALRS